MLKITICPRGVEGMTRGRRLLCEKMIKCEFKVAKANICAELIRSDYTSYLKAIK